MEEWAYEQRYGKGSWDAEVNKVLGKKGLPAGLTRYDPDVKRYWDEERAIGILERGGRFIGVACLFAKDMDGISKAALQFFDKYSQGGAGLEFAKDFGRLFATLGGRIKKEEDILFVEYEKLDK